MTKNQMEMAIMNGVTEILKPLFPKITTQDLIEALKKQLDQKNEIKTPSAIPEKPLTRQEAAALLAVSLNTVNRYMNTGLLRRIKIGPRVVRIDPTSVRKLIKGRREGDYRGRDEGETENLEFERKILRGIFSDEKTGKNRENSGKRSRDSLGNVT